MPWIFSITELFERFCFHRQELFQLTDEFSDDLQNMGNRNAALSLAIQTFIALRFYANGAFQNTVGGTINVHKFTACRAIQYVSKALQQCMSSYVYFPSQIQTAHRMQNFKEKCKCGAVGRLDP